MGRFDTLVPPCTLETTAANTPQTLVTANFFSPATRGSRSDPSSYCYRRNDRRRGLARDVILRRRVGVGCEEAVTWRKTAVVYHPCLATRLGGVSGGREIQGWRDSSHTAMVGAGKFGSAKLPMATATYPGKPSFSQ
jgi:hypothetical protein